MKRGSTISPITGATFVPAIGRSNSIWSRSRLRFATNWRSTCGSAGNFGLVPSNSSVTVIIWSLGSRPCADLRTNPAPLAKETIGPVGSFNSTRIPISASCSSTTALSSLIIPMPTFSPPFTEIMMRPVPYGPLLKKILPSIPPSGPILASRYVCAPSSQAGRKRDSYLRRLLVNSAQILAWHKSNPVSQRLATIPGIGPIIATAIAATLASLGHDGRDNPGWLAGGLPDALACYQCALIGPGNRHSDLAAVPERGSDRDHKRMLRLRESHFA